MLQLKVKLGITKQFSEYLAIDNISEKKEKNALFFSDFQIQFNEPKGIAKFKAICDIDF